jgi:hypothetical protein
MRKRTADFLQGTSSIDVPSMVQLLIALQSSGERGPKLRRRSARQLVDVRSGYRHKRASCGVVICPKSKSIPHQNMQHARLNATCRTCHVKCNQIF